MLFFTFVEVNEVEELCFFPVDNRRRGKQSVDLLRAKVDETASDAERQISEVWIAEFRYENVSLTVTGAYIGLEGYALYTHKLPTVTILQPVVVTYDYIAWLKYVTRTWFYCSYCPNKWPYSHFELDAAAFPQDICTRGFLSKPLPLYWLRYQHLGVEMSGIMLNQIESNQRFVSRISHFLCLDGYWIILCGCLPPIGYVSKSHSGLCMALFFVWCQVLVSSEMVLGLSWLVWEKLDRRSIGVTRTELWRCPWIGLCRSHGMRRAVHFVEIQVNPATIPSFTTLALVFLCFISQFKCGCYSHLGIPPWFICETSSAQHLELPEFQHLRPPMSWYLTSTSSLKLPASWLYSNANCIKQNRYLSQIF